MSGLRPIEIVGGGLAGLSLGVALRGAGVPVTLFEAGGYPRHRVCGEFISGLDPDTVSNLGIGSALSDAKPHRIVNYHLQGRPLRPCRLPSTAWGLSRHALDARLASAFVAAGGDLRTETRAAEDATPAGRVFAAGRKRKGPFWVGLKLHARGFPLAEDFEIHLGERAYVGLSRVESGAVNVCGIFAPRASSLRGPELMTDNLRAVGLSALAERILASEVDHDSFCVTAAPLGDRRIAPGDRLWIGDACASIAPFTGNGLAMALQGAELALAPLRAYASGVKDWPATVRTIAAAQRRRFGRRLRLASWFHPFFLEPRRQSLFAALVDRNLIPFRAFYGALH